MKPVIRKVFRALALLLLPVPHLNAAAPAAALDTGRIEQLTGLKGVLNESEGVFKVSYPRADIEAAAAGVRLTPPMGLTAWAAFTGSDAHAIVMGDVVMLEDQVNPVMSAALDRGLEVTALHNHFLWDSPKVMFMHIGGMGEASKLASSVGAVFAALKATGGGRGEVLGAAIDPGKTSLDPGKIEAVLGFKGELAKGVYKVTLPKKTRMHGKEMGAAMGVSTWAAFAGSDEKAAVAGDFAMYESELQGVLKALRHGRIAITAIHNHMAGETPRMVFLHYWGIGPAAELANTLKAALDTQGR